MKERIWVSNFSPDDITGGTEILGKQFCKALNLKYISARKLGIDLSGSLWEISAKIDSRLEKMPISFLLHNSTNCASKKIEAERSAVILCENFLVEGNAIKDVMPDLYIQKTTTDWTNQKKSINNADEIITISEKEKSQIENTCFGDKKISIIEPFVDLETFSPKKREHKKLTAVFVGRPHYRKGWDIVTKLSGLFPNIEFKNIINGNLTQEEVADAYNESDFLLMPSRYESFGFIYAEALASNLPIISSRVGLFGKWQPEEFGIFPEEITVESFAEAIKSFDKNNYSGMRELAETRFSFERFKEECNDRFGNRQ